MGSEVWVEDPDVAWIDGEVLEVRGDELIVKCSSGKKVSSDQLKVLVVPFSLLSMHEPFHTILELMHNKGFPAHQ